MDSPIIYTIGHSNHPLDVFLNLLNRHRINALYDVRSHPYSKRFKHFSKDDLRKTLAENNITYQFLGKSLGGRSDNPDYFHNGKISYALLAQGKEFKQEIDYVLEKSSELRIALMCAEGDPIMCHRTILISRHLAKKGVAIMHIMPNGAIQDQGACEKKLLHLFNKSDPDLFSSSNQDRLDEVYSRQGEKIAYSKSS